MLFDTWGGSLSGAAYREYSLTYMRRVVEGLIRERDGARIPVIVFTKGGGLWLQDIAAIGCDVVGLDWTVDIGSARALIGGRVAFAGESGPRRSVLAANSHRSRSRPCACAIRFRRWPHLQSRPWYFPAYGAGACGRPRRRGAYTQSPVSLIRHAQQKSYAQQPFRRCRCNVGELVPHSALNITY